MKTRLMVLAVAAALGFSGMGYAALSKEERKGEQKRISSEYKAAKEKCDGLKGNAKDICMAEAKGAQKVAKADLEARDKGTAKAATNARVAKAEAEYDVAKEKCDDLKGNAKDVCKKDAKAALSRAKSEAKASKQMAAAPKSEPKTSKEPAPAPKSEAKMSKEPAPAAKDAKGKY